MNLDISSLLLAIRNRYHPLFHLRKLAIFRALSYRLDRPVKVRFPAIRHPVYVSLSKNLSWIISAGKAIEESERDNFLTLVRLGRFKNFIDVGANIGIYGFLFASNVPGASVVFVEPDPENIALIKRTQALASSSADILMLEAVLSDREGTMTFYQDRLTGATGSLLSPETSFIASHHKTSPIPASVRSTTLDLACEASAKFPDLLKIDAEGAELSIFEGAQGTLDRVKPAIFFECDRNQEQVQALLAAKGYTFLDFESLKQVTSIPHNCLALHSENHRQLARDLRELSTTR